MMRAAGAYTDSIQARRTALGIFKGNLAALAYTEGELLAAFAESGKGYVGTN